MAVIGASRGIGFAAAHALAERNYDLIVGSRSASHLDAAAKRLRDAGASVLALTVDVTDLSSVSAFAERLDRSASALHGLVNCAGEAILGDFETTSPADFARMVSVNLTGVYAVTHALRASLRRGSGQVINVISRAGRQPYPNAIAYGAAKAGLVYLTRALAQAVAEQGIRVNAVSPGAVDTELRRNAVPIESGSRLMAPAAIGETIAELFNPAFTHVNGAVIDIPW